MAILALHLPAQGQRLLWQQTIAPITEAIAHSTVISEQEISGASRQVNPGLSTASGVVVVWRNFALTAIEARSGRTKWQFGRYLIRPVVVSKDTVFVRDLLGTLFALELQTGKLRWRKNNFADIYRMEATDWVLMLAQIGKGGLALSVYTGKTVWTLPQEEFFGSYNQFAVLWWHSESEARLISHLVAVSPNSGRVLWRDSANSNLIQQIGPYLWFDHRFGPDFTDGTEHLKLSRVDVRTAETQDFLVDLPPNQFKEFPVIERLNLEGNSLCLLEVWQAKRQLEFVWLGQGKQRHRFPLTPEARWWAGPLQGRVFLSNQKELYGIKTFNGQRVHYLELKGRSVSSLQVLGQHLLVVSNQQLLSFNIFTAQLEFQAATKVPAVQNAWVMNGVLLVTTVGVPQLLVFALPATWK